MSNHGGRVGRHHRRRTVESLHVEELERLRDARVVEAALLENVLDLLVGDLAALVKREEHARVAVLRNTARREQLREERAGRDVDAPVGVRKAHPAQGVARRPEHLDLGEHALLADDVHVPLIVLALAPLRHALVAEALGNGRPLEGEGERPLPLRDHARERGRHLRPQRDVALALVEEVVDLVPHLLARLAREKVVALHHARIVRLEARGVRRGPERVEHAIAPRHVLGVEIPHPARRLK